MKKKILILISLLLVVLAGGFLINRRFDKTRGTLPAPSIESSNRSFSPSPEKSLNPLSPEASSLPDAYLIKNFPFQPQAPYANWDELHDEACEEASVIFVYYYLKNIAIDASVMEEQIQKMVAFEIDKFGSHKDLTVQETGEVAKGFYGLENFRIENNITLEDIKGEVAQNHPVIVPAAGRLLGNPYFRSPGPLYHMVVVIGYQGNNIIVQDVGTRRGDHYEYNQKIFFNAIHDWNGAPETIEQGKKTMLVFE